MNKKIAVILGVLAVVLFAANTAMAGGRIYVFQLFDSQTISASSSATSQTIQLGTYKPEGYAGLHVEVSGSGTVRFELLGAAGGSSLITNPNGTSAIISGFTSTSGPGGDGKDVQPIDFGGPLTSIAIKATETGGSNSVTVSAWLVLQ